MDENTTTEAVIQDPGVEETQPVEQQAEADTQTVDSEPTTTNDSTQESPSTDDGLETWAKNKGLELDSESARKAALMARNAEKAMHQKAQKASELEKQLSAPTGYDDDRVARLEVIMQTRDFFDRNPEAVELEKDMAAYINENPVRRELIKEGYLSLDEVHAIVSSNPSRTSQLKAEGRKEGLQELANKQRATAVAGAANNAAPAPKVTSDNVEAWWDSLGTEGRKDPANRAKLDSLL